MIVVFDIDGTLADISHRLHHIEGANKNWDAFFADVSEDVCIEPIRRLLWSVQDAGYQIAFCTGRPEKTRLMTELWLLANVAIGSDDYLLYMRSDSDRRPDYEVKAGMLEKIGSHNILFVVEDRQQVVDMWRRNGVMCLQCADGHY
jgi:phosphoglycolate phosphatase-like HAD superfamily hydrolase